MFKVENDVLDLRFNRQKMKTLESMYNISLMAELTKNRGMLSLHLMEGLFSVGLYNTSEEKTVKGQKALDIFESLIEENGYVNLNNIIIGKLEEDLAFLFHNA
ncbi:hypothetical protein [Alkalihalobacillus trypoxylicola]|uniref:Uncharacterized protein n=1 Tax=Alkalihalobacillus trypoxylicola TaxID=519424 RepID=A0A162F6M5_9BACI|nr:hypothetical protein [Alkalihalobacillus trypoxylicola]KYG34909.1 hypothetical protein AZF04_00830 [Alkalihalobacillus trypoxylicola]